MLKGQIDFKSEPWPKISEAAKDCVRKLLEMDSSKRASSEQVCCCQHSPQTALLALHMWPLWYRSGHTEHVCLRAWKRDRYAEDTAL